MQDRYIELGITACGTGIVLAPVIGAKQFSPTFIMLLDMEAKGRGFSANMIGQMLIAALSAYHPSLKRYRLRPAPPASIPFPSRPPRDEATGEMRRMRMGMSVMEPPVDPIVILRTYDERQPLATVFQRALSELAQLGPATLPSLIGETMLGKLATMHPDLIALNTT